MAKKIKAFVKLALPAGKATPAPPVGPALGQHGVNIAALDIAAYTLAFEKYRFAPPSAKLAVVNSANDVIPPLEALDLI